MGRQEIKSVCLAIRSTFPDLNYAGLLEICADNKKLNCLVEQIVKSLKKDNATKKKITKSIKRTLVQKLTSDDFKTFFINETSLGTIKEYQEEYSSNVSDINVCPINADQRNQNTNIISDRIFSSTPNATTSANNSDSLFEFGSYGFITPVKPCKSPALLPSFITAENCKKRLFNNYSPNSECPEIDSEMSLLLRDVTPQKVAIPKDLVQSPIIYKGVLPKNSKNVSSEFHKSVSKHNSRVCTYYEGGFYITKLEWQNIYDDHSKRLFRGKYPYLLNSKISKTVNNSCILAFNKVRYKTDKIIVTAYCKNNFNNCKTFKIV